MFYTKTQLDDFLFENESGCLRICLSVCTLHFEWKCVFVGLLECEHE